MILLLLNTVLAYALGSLSGSLILGSMRHVDIRKAGSGNAGGTNAFRTQGFWFALGVVIIDIGKGAIAAGLLPYLNPINLADTVPVSTQSVWCGLAAIVGHSYPVWHGFRGGKGAATAIGTLCVIQPLALLPVIGSWVMVLGLSGWVGLSTMVAGISTIPAFVYLNASGAQQMYAMAMAAFLVFTHRENIRKMRRGEEFRFEKAMFRNWFR